MMDLKKIRARLVFSAVWVAITAGIVTQIKDLEQIRLVDFVTISAFGASIGVMIVFLVLYIKYRKNKPE
jgi:hypothetical protein